MMLASADEQRSLDALRTGSLPIFSSSRPGISTWSRMSRASIFFSQTKIAFEKQLNMCMRKKKNE
jgi:hypothetical protein